MRSTGLVVEDVEVDGKLYELVLNEARGASKGPPFNFDPIHGGGSATGRVFDSEIAKNRVVVCIVDHDRLAPMDKASSTANKVLRNHRRRNHEGSHSRPFIGMAMTTVGREAENLIPYPVFKTMYHDYECFDKLDEVLARERGNVETSDFWQYFDIKRGIDGQKILRKFSSGNLSEDTVCWISDKLGCAADQLQHAAVGGFGENVVQRFLENPDARIRFRAFTRTDSWKQRFGDYFDELLWFLAAPVRSRT